MKIFFTLFLLLVLLLSLSLSIDTTALELHDEALSRAFTTFALAKALNGVISLLQGTELFFIPVGIGVNFSVGEILDPFNDMVERFSWVMLFASVSLGIQKILLLLSSKIFVQIAISVSILFLLLLVWIKKLQNMQIFIYALKLFLLLLVLRFMAIIFVYTSQFFYTSVLQVEYESASSVVVKTQKELEDLENRNRLKVQSQKEQHFFEGMSEKYNRVIESLNISKQFEELQESLDMASSKMITLITIFVIQSILLPLLYLWLLLGVMKLIFNIEFNKEKLKLLYNDSKLYEKERR